MAFVVLAGLLLTSGLASGTTTAVRAGADRDGRPPDSPRNPQGDAATGLRADEAAALALLRRAATAQWTTAYAGTQFVAVWTDPGSSSELVDVTNIPGHGTVVRPNDSAPSEEGTFVARDDASNRTVGVQREGETGLGNVAALARSYTVRRAGPASSAGRAAQLVEASRADGSLAARFWVDRASGLVLRREVYDPNGVLARANGFVDLRIDAGAFLSHLPPMLSTEQTELVTPAAYARLTAQGWDCCAPALIAGLGLHDVRRTDGGAALHLTYSDGLTSASVFEQRGTLDESAADLEGFAVKRIGGTKVHVRYGLSSYAVWARNGLVYTAVCDTPRGLNAVVARFSPSRSQPDGAGLVQRLDRGMSRMVSWLNPFD